VSDTALTGQGLMEWCPSCWWPVELPARRPQVRTFRLPHGSDVGKDAAARTAITPTMCASCTEIRALICAGPSPGVLLVDEALVGRTRLAPLSHYGPGREFRGDLLASMLSTPDVFAGLRAGCVCVGVDNAGSI
jgi:hypothetical protein